MNVISLINLNYNDSLGTVLLFQVSIVSKTMKNEFKDEFVCLSAQCCSRGWTAPAWGGPPECRTSSPLGSCWPWRSSSSWALCRSARVSSRLCSPQCMCTQCIHPPAHTCTSYSDLGQYRHHMAPMGFSELPGPLRFNLTSLISAGLRGFAMQTWLRGRLL